MSSTSLPETEDLDLPRRIGPYVIGRRLEAGDMGPTYEASRIDAEARVALTFVPSSETLAAPELFEFLQEFRRRHPLPHPGIALVSQVRPGGRHPFVASGFVPAGTLRDWARSRPDRATAIESIRSLALAVDLLHAKGLARITLAPESVLVGDDGRPRLSEFLIGREIHLREKAFGNREDAVSGRRTRAGCLVDDPVVVDLFGLGNLLHLGLVGRPAAGPGLPGLIDLLDREAWTPGQGELDEATEAVCRRALGLDQTDRYPSAGAFAEDLHRLLREPSRSPRPAAARGRRRTTAGLAVAAAAAIALGAGYVFRGRLLEDLGAPAEDARALERATLAPFRELVEGEETPPAGPDASVARAEYAAALRGLLAGSGPRQVTLHVERHLHEPYLAEETLRGLVEFSLGRPDDARAILLDLTPDAFETLMAGLAEGSEPAAGLALDLVGNLALERANLHVLRSMARHDAAWTARCWSAYEAANGPDPAARLAEDLDRLGPEDEASAAGALRRAGLGNR